MTIQTPPNHPPTLGEQSSINPSERDHTPPSPTQPAQVSAPAKTPEEPTDSVTLGSKLPKARKQVTATKKETSSDEPSLGVRQSVRERNPTTKELITLQEKKRKEREEEEKSAEDTSEDVGHRGKRAKATATRDADTNLKPKTKTKTRC
ncbi:hypothetical protein K435DRAFT_793742 [Dendrothele bispora CBS 962.96]|uniref:Uncharacterized protein n=1 Tax=Dendrothele bispora (strain CBS 962.96) TaxID=1314807 RepID=A0A4S8ME76_DENBC|nr:hypothetical protein K435DRAFT_793742 [Dendrothele bispora CBS 962.96]